LLLVAADDGALFSVATRRQPIQTAPPFVILRLVTALGAE